MGKPYYRKTGAGRLRFLCSAIFNILKGNAAFGEDVGDGGNAPGGVFVQIWEKGVCRRIGQHLGDVDPLTVGQKLLIHLLAANNWNVVQYAVLVHMMAQVSGLEAGELVHVIADAHIYDRHVPIIEKMLKKEPRPAPKFVIDPSVTDFYRFTRDSFSLEGYDPQPFEDKIPVAI